MTEKQGEMLKETRTHRIKSGIKEWLKRHFTLEGREAIQREKLAKKYAKVLAKVPAEQRTGAEALIQKQAHDRAVGSIVKDALLTTMAVGAGAGVIAKRGEIGEELVAKYVEFAEKHPTFVEKITTPLIAKFSELKSSIKDFDFKARVKAIAQKIFGGKK